MTPPPERIWNGPNILTLSRLGWAVALFACVAYGLWTAALAVFLVAAASDWLDGVWARRTNQLTSFGRNMDPLIDKVLIGGAFIYLLPVREAELLPWMVTLVVGRELLVTGVRGLVEQAGKSFGADGLGKLKMVSQCLAVGAFLLARALAGRGAPDTGETLRAWGYVPLLWLALALTLASGLQYLVKAARLLSNRAE